MALPKEDADNILEAAFDGAFSPPSSRRQSLRVPLGAPSTLEEPIPEVPPAQPMDSSPVEDAWRQEYDEQVKSWRAQSAEARDKAEKVREQWEAKRAAEREEAARRKAAGIPSQPEVIPEAIPEADIKKQGEERDKAKPAVQGSLTSVDVRELVSGQPQRHSVGPSNETLSRAQSQPDTTDGSQKWEEVNSPATSSYPSLSFPEQTDTPPAQPHPPPTSAPQSVTLSVFDSSLSTRTRLKALTSSLVINLVLPFVNGVMLGFGEIFAKKFVLGWFGWGVTATTVGITQRQRPGFR